MITRAVLAIFMALFAAAAGGALDLPIDLGFRLGFKTEVMPGPGDMSRHFGLVVAPHTVRSDRRGILTVSGTITNAGDLPLAGVAMRFRVTHYAAIGSSHGRATVEPDCLPPGATARFSAHISLDSAMPHRALYTVTACPAGAAAE